MSHIYNLRKTFPVLCGSLEKLCHTLQTKNFGPHSSSSGPHCWGAEEAGLEMLLLPPNHRAFMNFYDGKSHLNSVITHLRHRGSHTRAAVWSLMEPGSGGGWYPNPSLMKACGRYSPRRCEPQCCGIPDTDVSGRQGGSSQNPYPGLLGWGHLSATEHPTGRQSCDEAYLFKHRKWCLKNQPPCFSLKLLHSVMSGS